MQRNILILLGSLLILGLAAYFSDSQILMWVLSGLVSVLAFFGAATVCLVTAPICIPAVSIGLVVFLMGLGLSTKSAIVIISVSSLIILGILGYLAFCIFYSRKEIPMIKVVRKVVGSVVVFVGDVVCKVGCVVSKVGEVIKGKDEVSKV